MATGLGTVVIDFGVFPGTQETSVNFADVNISAGSKISIFIMSADSAGTHTPNDHKYLGMFAAFTAEPIAGVGGTVFGVSLKDLIGQFKLRYVWAD